MMNAQFSMVKTYDVEVLSYTNKINYGKAPFKVDEVLNMRFTLAQVPITACQ
jgi:hypothetical protein